MPIEFVCRCGKSLKIPDELVGRQFKCPACQAVVTAPQPAGSPGPAAANYEPPGALVRAMSQNTMASNPGGLRVDYLAYFRSYPLWPSLLAAAIPIAGILGLTAPPKQGWSVPVAVLALNLFYWFRVTMAFRHGCVNPAVVVSTRPYLVAVSTDLDSSGRQPWWVVKILRQPLEKMAGGPPEVGTRLATIAMYEGSLSAGRWNNFDPKVVDCATRNPREIQRILASIPREEWLVLEAGLKQLPPPPKPGLYKINPTP